MRGIIFDFNGTMFFDEKLQQASWRLFLEKKINRPVTEFEFQKYVHGRNADITLSYFLNRHLSQKEIMDLEEEKEIIYRSMCLESPEFKLAEGLPEFLDELVRQNAAFTIATASGLNNVRFFFEQLQLDRWFSLDKVLYNDGTIPGKPEPDLYLKAADRIETDIQKCIVFEDARSGIEAALRAGAAKVIGVSSMLNGGELLSLGASTTISDYNDLQALLNEIKD